MPGVGLHTCAVKGQTLVGEEQDRRAGSKNVPASLKTLLSSETNTLNSNPDFKTLVFFKGKCERVHTTV